MPPFSRTNCTQEKVDSQIDRREHGGRGALKVNSHLRPFSQRRTSSRPWSSSAESSYTPWRCSRLTYPSSHLSSGSASNCRSPRVTHHTVLYSQSLFPVHTPPQRATESIAEHGCTTSRARKYIIDLQPHLSTFGHLNKAELINPSNQLTNPWLVI